MTTEELSITEVAWGDHRIRFLELDGGKYVPVTDIAKATGVRKTSLLKVIDNNPEVFSKHERDLRSETPGGIQTTRCIDATGAYLLLTRISTNHIRNPETKASLIAFNEWMMQRAAGKAVPQLPAAGPDYNAILNKIKFVKELSGITGWNLLELQKEVLREAGLQSLTWHIEPEQKALPAPAPKPKVKDYMTATDIGELCGMSAQQINKFLYNNQYIIKDDAYDWRMTELGREYGEERVLEPSTGILVITCYWKPSILEKMNIRVKG